MVLVAVLLMTVPVLVAVFVPTEVPVATDVGVYVLAGRVPVGVVVRVSETTVPVLVAVGEPTSQ
jgi:hypothetical protein